VLRLPVVVAQVRGLGHEFFLALKIRFEVLCFESVRVVDVARYLARVRDLSIACPPMLSTLAHAK